MSLKATICHHELIAEVCSIADSGLQRVFDEVITGEEVSLDLKKNETDNVIIDEIRTLELGKNIGWTQRNPFGCAILGSNILGRSCTNDHVPLGSEIVQLLDSVSVYRFDGTDTKEYFFNEEIELVENTFESQDSVKSDIANISDNSSFVLNKGIVETSTVSDSNSVTQEKVPRFTSIHNSLGSFGLGSELLGSSFNTDQPDYPIYFSDEVSWSMVLGTYENPNDSIGLVDSIYIERSVSVVDSVGTDDVGSPWFYEATSDTITINDSANYSVGIHQYVDDSIYPIYDSPLEYEHKKPTGDEALMTDIVSVKLFRYGTLGTNLLGSKTLG